MDKFCIRDLGNDSVGDIADFLKDVAIAFKNDRLPESLSVPFWRLIQRIGQDKVDWLEGPHEPQK